MMDFGHEPATRRDIGVVPMINIVFLLLVFFLMTASIAPPEPFDTRPPEGEGEHGAAGPERLYLSATGEAAFGAARGPAAIAAAAARDAAEGPLVVQADAALPAVMLAGVLAELAKGGVADIDLVTVLP